MASAAQVSKDNQAFEHLQWLCPKDQQVLYRAECNAALKEEKRLLTEMENAMLAHQRAMGHCQVVSETDRTWFTLDVQDSHAKHVQLLATMLQELQESAMPIPEGDLGDTIFGNIYSSYAQTAQVTARAAAGLSERTVPVQAMRSSARSALGLGGATGATGS
ncbi:unnamed protein product [Cladocopium goreaui]|uniref:Uncharacterized protein n=1 Tax=Cladocopium goreaui TaxID=2562237 RepID=A0A9P1C0P6_9DINO|nr:unnamed protein product [Cladocopium goreaui]